jgi:hypothetical protein
VYSGRATDGNDLGTGGPTTSKSPASRSRRRWRRAHRLRRALVLSRADAAAALRPAAALASRRRRPGGVRRHHHPGRGQDCPRRTRHVRPQAVGAARRNPHRHRQWRTHHRRRHRRHQAPRTARGARRDRLERALRGREDRQLERWSAQVPGAILTVQLDTAHPSPSAAAWTATPRDSTCSTPARRSSSPTPSSRPSASSARNSSA